MNGEAVLAGIVVALVIQQLRIEHKLGKLEQKIIDKINGKDKR